MTNFTNDEKTEILATADGIQELLKALPTARHAAMALSIAQAGFIHIAGGATRDDVDEMLAEANRATIKYWYVVSEAPEPN